MTINIKRLEDIAHIETPPAPSRPYGQKAGRRCKDKCKNMEGYVNMRRIKFAIEMGYRKCKMCDCYFFKPDYNKCKCCKSMFNIKPPRRTIKAKFSAQKFKMEVSEIN
jgi:hypothetical protein